MRIRAFCLIGILFTLTGLIMAQDETQDGQDYLDRATQLVNEGNFEQAIYNYTYYLRTYPATVDVLSDRAFAYASIDKQDLADQDITTAFDLAGFSAIKQAVVYNRRAQIILLRGDTDAALTDLDRALELDPDKSTYWLSRAIYYQIIQDWQSALADYDHYLSIDPNNAEIYLNRARIYLQLNDGESAIDELSTAITITPEDSELYIFRGSVNLQLKHMASAAADYAEWLYQINSEEQTLDPIKNTETRDLTMAYGRLYRIPFEAVSGDRIGVAANSTTVDSLVVLLDPQGKPIMVDDDGGRGLNSFFVDFSLPVDGTYTLLIGHARGGWTGDIHLTFQLEAASGI